jgi:hypothetical protein
MRTLSAVSAPLDVLSLSTELGKRGPLNDIGWDAFLSSLVDGVPDRGIGDVQYYVEQVRKRSGCRQIQEAASKLQAAAESPSATIAELRKQASGIDQLGVQYESGRSHRITKIEDIPDPFSCATDPGWVVPGLIPKGGITVVAGEPGVGKSWFALALANQVNLGGMFLGKHVERWEVLYLDRENPIGVIQTRLRQSCATAPCIRPWGLWCPDEPPSIGDSRLVELARDGLLMVFDSLIRFHDADENSATEMGRVMAQLRWMASLGACILVLHHRSKSENSSYRGSSEILAGADVAFSLARRGKHLVLRTIKNRFAEDATLKICPDFRSGSFVLDTSCTGLESDDTVNRLSEIIASMPGLSQNEITRRAGIQRQRVSQILREHEGRLWRSERNGRELNYFLVGVDRFPSSSTGRNHFSDDSESGSNPDSHCWETLGTSSLVPGSPPLKGGDRESLDLQQHMKAATQSGANDLRDHWLNAYEGSDYV